MEIGKKLLEKAFMFFKLHNFFFHVWEESPVHMGRRES